MTHWADLGETTFVWGIRFLFVVYRLLGRWPFRVVLYPVLLWYIATQPKARAASRNYLKRAGIKQRFAVFKHFASFAETLLDKMLVWSGSLNRKHVTFSGHEVIVEQIAAGKGGLFICAHLGNLELCRVMSQQRKGLKLTVLTHTKHAKAFNRLLASIDPSSQLNLLQVTEISPATAMELSQKIDNGEFVVIAGDRIPVSVTPNIVFAPFLGAPAPFPIGPYVLASALQCPTYLLFALRAEQGYSIFIEPFVASIHLPRRARATALTTLAEQYAARLEYYCNKAPLQWFNFYDFWHYTKVGILHEAP